MAMRYQAHPWHGVSLGELSPDVVTAYIEIAPTQTVKFELDKPSGYLSVDRPQNFSSMVPALYGLVPQTYCGESVAKFCAKRTGKTGIVGDGDPLDICVLTEKAFAHGDCLMRARPIGGLRMIDKGEADDKIIAVLVDDVEFGDITDVSQLKKGVIKRLQHYFLSYKQLPGENARTVEITHVYGRKDALEVIRRSAKDYKAKFGNPAARDDELWQLLVAAVAESLQPNNTTRRRRR